MRLWVASRKPTSDCDMSIEEWIVDKIEGVTAHWRGCRRRRSIRIGEAAGEAPR